MLYPSLGTIKQELGISIALFSLLSFGCSSAPEPTPYHFSGFLTSYSGFRPSPDGSQAWSYRKPGLDLKPYTSVMIDPLVIWRTPESTFRGLNSGDIWQMRVTFHEKMVQDKNSETMISRKKMQNQISFF